MPGAQAHARGCAAKRLPPSRSPALTPPSRAPPARRTSPPQVCRNAQATQAFSEFMQLEFLREIGFCHMRIGDGVNSRLQLSGLLAKLCRVAVQSGARPAAAQQQQQQAAAG